ncbi:MAG: type II toxin-antitoxin system death-on-curing family toxin [Armatimonadota bacterium]|nr:type II toxin-antitoxin system death-on-curing family toxin [Armatimonadota bacterium]
MAEAFETLSEKDIIGINTQMIDRFGGLFVPPDNIQNSGSLQHTLETIQGFMFGAELCPTIPHKAAVLGHRIISRHVFWDACKRMATECVLLLLELNGFELEAQESDLVDITLRIATGEIDEDEFIAWVSQRATGAE